MSRNKRMIHETLTRHVLMRNLAALSPVHQTDASARCRRGRQTFRPLAAVYSGLICPLPYPARSPVEVLRLRRRRLRCLPTSPPGP
jgi:hypothetical protein